MAGNNKASQLKQLREAINNNKKNILCVIHSDFRKDASDNAGGTQYHVRDLVFTLKDKYNFFVVARDIADLNLTIYSGDKEYFFKFPIGEFNNSIYSEVIKRTLTEIINYFRIDMIHVHHVYHLSLDIYDIAEELNIPIMTTLHDYYYICPSIKMIDTKHRFCPNYNKDEGCAKCEAACGYDVKKWRADYNKVLSKSDKLILPSEAAKSVYAKYYNEFSDKMVVCPHGSEYLLLASDFTEEIIENGSIIENVENIYANENKIEGWVYLDGTNSQNIDIYMQIFKNEKSVSVIKAGNKPREDVAVVKGEQYRYSGFEFFINQRKNSGSEYSARIVVGYEGKYYTSGHSYKLQNKSAEKNQGFNVAFVGGMVEAKGSRIACEMIKNCKDGNKINWYIFGAISPVEKELLSIKQDNLKLVGQYEKDDIYNILKAFEIDMVCILPIWAETFCYTLSEAWLCKIPTMATDIGAIADRTREFDCGFVIPTDMAADKIDELIINISKDKEEYSSKCKNLEAHCVLTLPEMGKQYEGIYNSYSDTVNYSSSGNEAFIKKGYISPDGNPKLTFRQKLKRIKLVRKIYYFIRRK